MEGALANYLQPSPPLFYLCGGFPARDDFQTNDGASFGPARRAARWSIIRPGTQSRPGTGRDARASCPGASRSGPSGHALTWTLSRRTTPRFWGLEWDTGRTPLSLSRSGTCECMPRMESRHAPTVWRLEWDTGRKSRSRLIPVSDSVSQSLSHGEICIDSYKCHGVGLYSNSTRSPSHCRSSRFAEDVDRMAGPSESIQWLILVVSERQGFSFLRNW